MCCKCCWSAAQICDAHVDGIVELCLFQCLLGFKLLIVVVLYVLIVCCTCTVLHIMFVLFVCVCLKVCRGCVLAMIACGQHYGCNVVCECLWVKSVLCCRCCLFVVFVLHVMYIVNVDLLLVNVCCCVIYIACLASVFVVFVSVGCCTCCCVMAVCWYCVA